MIIGAGCCLITSGLVVGMAIICSAPKVHPQQIVLSSPPWLPAPRPGGRSVRPAGLSVPPGELPSEAGDSLGTGLISGAIVFGLDLGRGRGHRRKMTSGSPAFTTSWTPLGDRASDRAHLHRGHISGQNCGPKVVALVWFQVSQRVNGRRRTKPAGAHHRGVLILAARARRIVLPVCGAGLEPGTAIPERDHG